jgi:FAD/FMN-containing dehydrogenase
MENRPTAVGVPLGKPLDEAATQAFAAHFRGDLIRPEDDTYDQVRRVFNAMIDRRPAIIARCTGVADVIAAVNFARENELVVAVRGGGHHVAGYGTCDGGIVIDLSPMKGVWVDPEARVARAQAGLTWGELDRETQQFGLATTGGRITHTGVAGQTLGSGSGWLERKYGLTCDNLLSADVVTADGRFVRASPDENPELYWGLRGGGGNFGIVTSFEFHLHPVGPIVLGGLLLYPFSKAGEVLRYWRDYVESAPDELGSAPAIFTAPPAPFVPEEMKGQPAVGLIICYAGSIEDGEAAVKPLREFGPPVVDLVEPMPYTVVQSLLDPANPPGKRNYWKSENMNDLSDAAIDTLVGCASQLSSPFTEIVIEPKGRAISRVGENETAIGGRDSAHTLYIFTLWDNPSEDDTHIAWTRSFMETMSPYTAPGVSLNFTSDQGQDRVKDFFGRDGKLGRLTDLKKTYDPTNLFRLNQNIRPAER